MRTAEAVSPGHPDKISDQISDAILDAYLTVDPDARVAVEVMGGHGKLYICGEVTSKVKIDKSEISRIAKQVYKEIGYNDSLKVQVHLVQQSPDIAQGVDTGGAGDQGIMVGYACNDNEEMIPQELYLARKILKEVLALGYGPDGKSQVTLDDDGKITQVVVSVQHPENIPLGLIETSVWKRLDIHIPYDYNLIVNGTGKFVIGGFQGDTGLTGRKIVQDAYGPQVPVGGGAFSGKDPSKVDRSAAYMARSMAVDWVKKGYGDKSIVKIAYSIGIAEPLMVTINGKSVAVNSGLTPKEIIDYLDLKKPIYRKTAEWGAFGQGQRWDNAL